MADSDPYRDALHKAMQDVGHATVEGALLTGWVIVQEWMAPDGERWLSKGHAAQTAAWSAHGMLHDALYGDWPDTEDDAE